MKFQWSSLAFLSLMIFSLSCRSTAPEKSYLSDNYTPFNVKVGSSDIYIYTYTKKAENPKKKLVFVNVHHNEDTSAIAAKEVIEEHGGTVSFLVPSQHLKISTKTVRGQKFRFDPSQILTLDDVLSTLREHNPQFNQSSTAGKEIIEYLKTNRRTLLEKSRLLSFTHAGKSYTFDPNRIFSDRGIKATLEANSSGTISNSAIAEVRLLRNALLRQLGVLNSENLVNSKVGTIIALHNNTDGSYSLGSYMSGGGESENAKRLYRGGSGSEDLDNFYFVTNAKHFSFLKEMNQSVIMQNNAGATDDGSLSYYCGFNKINYINIEAQHRFITKQKAMISLLYDSTKFDPNVTTVGNLSLTNDNSTVLELHESEGSATHLTNPEDLLPDL